MRYDKWNDLFNYLMINPCDGKPWPLKEMPGNYTAGLRNRLHDFFEECRLNFAVENSSKLISMTASDLIDKLIDLRKHNFSIQGNEIIHRPSNMAIDKIENENHIKFLNTQLEYYDKTIKYLSKYLTEPSNGPDDPSFTVNSFDEYSLEGIMNKMMDLNLIEKDTERAHFVRIFTGKTPKKKIIWIAGPGLLYYFIKNINGNSVNKVRAIWKTTVNCFQGSDSNFEAGQLKGEKDPKYTNDIDQIIKMFNRKK